MFTLCGYTFGGALVVTTTGSNGAPAAVILRLQSGQSSLLPFVGDNIQHR
jgi:hypothetical protein